MATLSVAFAELTHGIVKTTEETESSECNYLSVRMKTYHAHHSEQEKLLCHFKVSSSCRFPVVDHLREQKLRQLAEFLLHVQQDDEDCHCVLVTRTATSPDSTQPFLTSRVSLTLTRQQRARDCDDLSPAGVSHHGGIKGDNCHSMGRNCGSKKAGCGESSSLEGSEVVVESKDLVDLASGVENDKPGFHFHIRFPTDKITVMKEGKVIHDFLRQMHLFQPAMKMSFLLNIDGQISRANFRFQGRKKVQGQSVISDPQYFTHRSTLTSRVFMGTSETHCSRHPLRLRCLVCHVTSCLPSATSGQPRGTVTVFGPHGVPVLDEGKWSLTEALSTLVEWRRFGLVPAAHSSDQHGKEEACLRVAVADTSALPAWAAGSDRFVLALNFLCSTLPHTPMDYAVTLQHVHDLIDSSDRSDLRETATAALHQLYRPSLAAFQQQDQTLNRLNELLPLVWESVAEIYTRSQNLFFRRAIEHLTQADGGKSVACVLRQGLQALLDPSVRRGPLPAAPPADSQPSPDQNVQQLPGRSLATTPSTCFAKPYTPVMLADVAFNAGPISPPVGSFAGPVEFEHLAASVLDREHLAASMLDREHLAASVLDREHLAASVLDREHLAASVLDREHLASSVLHREHLASSVLDREHLASSVLHREHLAASVLHREHLASPVLEREHLAASVDADLELELLAASMDADSECELLDASVDAGSDLEHLAASVDAGSEFQLLDVSVNTGSKLLAGSADVGSEFEHVADSVDVVSDYEHLAAFGQREEACSAPHHDADVILGNTPASEEPDMVSLEEESWFSQMEQELTW